MATPRLVARIVLDILIDESVMPLFEARPPILPGSDSVIGQNVFYALNAEPRSVIRKIKPCGFFVKGDLIQTV